MFHQKESCKFLKIEIVLLIALTAFVVSGQTPKSDEIRSLSPNQTIEAELLIGQKHRYRVTLAVNEFLQARVEQKGIDVIVELFDASGKLVAQMDSPNLAEGFETLSWVADKAETYEIEIIPFNYQIEKGKYVLQRTDSRKATEQDKQRVENERMFMEALLLQSKDDEAGLKKVSPLLEKVVQGWERQGDKYMTELTSKQHRFVSVIQNDSVNQRDLLNYLQYTKEQLWMEGYATADAIRIFRKYGAKRYLANSFLRLGYISVLIGENKVGMDAFNEALFLFKYIVYKRGEAISYLIIGRTFYTLGDNQKALDLLNKALDIFKLMLRTSH